MMETIWIDGKPFHARYTDEYYDLTEDEQDFGDNTIYLEPILYEDGEPIPKRICICAAHSDDECCCGALYGNYDEYFKEE